MGPDKTHFAILGEVDLQGFGIVLEPQRGHGKQNVLAIDRLSLLLLTLFRRFATDKTSQHQLSSRGGSGAYLRW